MELTPQEVLELAKKWQLDPVAKTQDLDKEKEIIPVLRDDELSQIQKITKLNVSQTDFNHAFGWIVAEGKILDFIEEEFRNSQPDPKLLEQLEKEKQAVENKKTIWQKHYKNNQEKFTRGNEEDWKKLADENFKDEFKPEQAQLTGGGREILNVSTPASPPPSPTRVPTRVQVGVSAGYNFNDFRRHPSLIVSQAWGGLKNYFSKFFGQKTAGTVSGQAVGAITKQAAVQTGEKVTKKLVGEGIKAGGKKLLAGLATKLGLAAVPTGVTQAVALALAAKDFLGKLIPPELQEKLKDLWSMMQIGAAGAIGWLLMNLGALAGGIIGGMIGGFIGGPIGAAAGFGAGAFLGYSLQGILGPILFPGTVGGIGGSIIPGVSAAPVAPAGFTLPAGLSTAASSFGALLSGTGLPTIALFGVGGGIGLVSLFTVLTIITVGATQPPEPSKNTGYQNSGSLVSVINQVDKTSLVSDSGQSVIYTVTISSVSEEIEISVDNQETLQNSKGTTNLPVPKFAESFPSKLGKSQSVTFTANPYLITSDFNNSSLINTVTVTAKLVSDTTKTETLSDKVTTTIGSPAYTGKCVLAPEGNPCSVTNLMPYFDNDQIKAEKASRICYAERGWQNPLNDACKIGLHREYSVGIFQINLFAHDNLCPAGTFPKPLKLGKYPASDACVRDEELLQQCREEWAESGNNAREAYILSKNGTNWSAWSTSKQPSASCPQCCGIQ